MGPISVSTEIVKEVYFQFRSLSYSRQKKINKNRRCKLKRELFLTNLAVFFFFFLFPVTFRRSALGVPALNGAGASCSPGPYGARVRARLLLREHPSALLSGSGGLLGAAGLALPRPHPASCLPGGCSRTRSGRGAGLNETREGSSSWLVWKPNPPKRSVAQLDCLLSHCKQTRVNTGCQLPGAPRSRGQLRVAGGWRPAPAPKAGGSETPLRAPRRD